MLAASRKLTNHSRPFEVILHGDASGGSHYVRRLLSIARHEPAIKFAGPYPNRSVGQVLGGLDVIVVPSVWYENRPTVIVEAHATRTPVIAAQLGGMAELIKHDENGLLFKAGDVESLAAHLQRLLDEPALLPRLRSAIQPVPDVEEETARLVSLYESLTGRSQSPHI